MVRAKGPRGGEVGGVPPWERSRGFSLPGWPRFHLFSESLDRGPPAGDSTCNPGTEPPPHQGPQFLRTGV